MKLRTRLMGEWGMKDWVCMGPSLNYDVKANGKCIFDTFLVVYDMFIANINTLTQFIILTSIKQYVGES
jgi:hypothetical protein